jgi:hypothetical protein
MILLELDCDFNNISVRSFILTGAPLKSITYAALASDL